MVASCYAPLRTTLPWLPTPHTRFNALQFCYTLRGWILPPGYAAVCDTTLPTVAVTRFTGLRPFSGGCRYLLLAITHTAFRLLPPGYSLFSRATYSFTTVYTYTRYYEYARSSSFYWFGRSAVYFALTRLRSVPHIGTFTHARTRTHTRT